MRPVHARSTVQCFYQVCKIFSTNAGCGFRSSGAPEADGSCQVLTTIKSERKIRSAHIVEPFVFENDLFRFQLANLLHHRTFEGDGSRSLLINQRLWIQSVTFTNQTLVSLGRIFKQGRRGHAAFAFLLDCKMALSLLA